jgi:phospholipase D1/2
VAILLAVLLGLAGLAAVWRFTPLGSRVDLDTIVQGAAAIRESSAAPFIIIATYLVGGLVVFPVTVLISATAIVFEPLSSIIYASVGCLASAVLMYGIGSALGRATVRRVAGSKLNRLSKWLARRGLLTVATRRVVPIAPYSIVNIVAGASHIRFRDFILGTVVGLAPGIVAISVLVGHVERIIQDPRLKHIVVVAVLTLLCVGAFLLIRRHLVRNTKHKDATSFEKER